MQMLQCLRPKSILGLSECAASAVKPGAFRHYRSNPVIAVGEIEERHLLSPRTGRTVVPATAGSAHNQPDANGEFAVLTISPGSSVSLVSELQIGLGWK